MSITRSLQPVSAPLDAAVVVPGSKSITIRAMACAALAEGRSHVYDGLDADDTKAMAAALTAFGVSVNTSSEPWTIDGLGRHLQAPRDVIDAIESGLTARISIVMASLADGGDTTIDGQGRLSERPMEGLLEALKAQGVAVTATEGHLPVTVTGQTGLWGEVIEVDCSGSSQFATALLLGAPMASRSSSLKPVGLAGSAGYLDVTIRVMEAFGAQVTPTLAGFDVEPSGYQPQDYVVEPDISAAVYPMVSAAITGGRVELPGVWLESLQPDIHVAQVLESMGCQLARGESGLVVDANGVRLGGIETDLSGCPDGAMAVAVACLFAEEPSRLDGLFSLRHKESDRLQAMSDGINALGGNATIDEDALIIEPQALTGGVVDSFGDHRVAMSLALAGLRVPAVEVSNPDVVAKTWPGFWETMGTAFV